MANRLQGETSPYLLQHKDNPVDWYPWGPEALSRAVAEEKPILLSIGYSSCHWCHVMAHESFEDDATAAYMNEHFVCLKVDREERPDLDAIYMEAVQAMTGHGGWPLTAFLTPQQAPFYAGTYFPPAPRQGMPSFRQVLEAIADAWDNRRAEVLENSATAAEQLSISARIAAPQEAVSDETLHGARATLESAFDAEFGGFGDAPKFPQPPTLEFLLASGGEHAQMAIDTLESMVAGGIHDQVGGGFARYSVDRHWLVPHFEKMLYDNALLATALLHAWQIGRSPRLLEACRMTLGWMLREMRGPEGGFYSAYDADSEGVEGKFYVWSKADLVATLEANNLPTEQLVAYWGVTEEGNFEGGNILFVADENARPDDATLARARKTLCDLRARRIWPGLDDKRLTAWNALAIKALAEAADVLEDERYLAAAVAAGDFLISDLRGDEGRMLRTWKDGQAKLSGYLEDHAFSAEAMLTLYEATFDERWFTAARELVDATLEFFRDPEGGGFYSTAHDHEQLFVRRKDLEDNPIPSGNASIAMALLRLAALTGDRRYREPAEEVLRMLQKPAARYSTGFGHLLQAIDFYLGPTREVAIVGPDPAPMRRALATQPRFRVVIAGGLNPGDSPIVPLLAHRGVVDGKTAAYVCENFVCRQPVTEPDELAAELQN